MFRRFEILGPQGEVLPTLTRMSTTSLLNGSMEWADDVASDMDIFFRLSKAGHHERAIAFFDEYAFQYATNFPVAAEYGAALVDQSIR